MHLYIPYSVCTVACIDQVSLTLASVNQSKFLDSFITTMVVA